MKTKIRLDDKELGKMETFLDSMLYRDDTHTLYQITKLEGDLYEVELTDEACSFLQGYDHDCKDGCTFCGYLVTLGLLPDIDDVEYDEEYPTDGDDTAWDAFKENGWQL